MSFVRPEALATLMRWREALVGAVAFLLGLWWMIGPGGLLVIPGGALILGGFALMWIGRQRGRFRGAGGGVGQVQVDEGQITYFGPLTGGVIALQDVDQLSLRKDMFPDHWQLEQRGQPPLLIPVNALGANALFDAFATLPGLRTERMLSVMQAGGDQMVVIWRRYTSADATRALH